jgi:hypothetical protein
MRIPQFLAVLLFGLAAGCAGQSSVKPVEALDERTGMTLASLKEPIELLPSAQHAALAPGKRTSFAYLGPVEWNSMGTIAYGLWIHIAPGNDVQADDIHAVGTLTLILDDGTVALSVIDAPKLGRDPYKRVVPWGQTAYFDLPVDLLKRMAASVKLGLDVRTVDGSITSFSPTLNAHAALTEYLQARGITGD